MNGLNKPVFAYYDAKPFYGTDEELGLYADRVRKFYSVSKENPDRDNDGQSIENFETEDNLMMIGSLKSGADEISKSFESAVLAIAKAIQTKPLH